MREVVFTVEYEKGVDEVMDLFIAHPDLHARSMEVHATSESVGASRRSWDQMRSSPNSMIA